MSAAGISEHIGKPWAWHRQNMLGTLRVGTDPEWLISWGRLISVLFAALAIYVDPTFPTRSLREAHLILAAYVLFSLYVAFRKPRRPLGSAVHLFTHGVDVCALTALVWFTDELDSPFFPFVPFILLATTMRWGIRGAILGALMMELMMIAVGWDDLTDGAELNVVIMRSAYFLVAAAMLGYFGSCRARNSQRFARLASWSAAPSDLDERRWLGDMLGQASRLLNAQFLILLWQNDGMSGGKVAMYGPDGLAVDNILKPNFWQARTASVAGKELSTKAAIVEVEAIASATGWTQLASPSRWLRSAPLVGSRTTGRLFILNATYEREDAEALARITALRIGHELERYGLLRASADRVRDQERVRLARDLHDSVLQDLAAASLRLKAASATMPENAHGSLNGVSLLLMEQQRRIRQFVENSRALKTTPTRLSSSLAQTASELRDQWGCDIVLSLDPHDLTAPCMVQRELTQLLCEATANAVRHGGATRLNVELKRQDQNLRVMIADNGCGMLLPEKAGAQSPRSLRARVEDLDGSLAITCYAPGLAMTIDLPLP